MPSQTIGRRIAEGIADDLIARGCMVPPSRGGIKRERLVNLIQRQASKHVAALPESRDLNSSQQIFVVLAKTLVRCRSWISSLTKTSQRENVLDEIERALLVSAKRADRS